MALSDREPYVLSVDIGTSSVRASVYDSNGSLVPGTQFAKLNELKTSSDGTAELDPDALVDKCVQCMASAARELGNRRIATVATSSFWHSVVGVGADGAPTTPVLTWMDTRSHSDAKVLSGLVDPKQLHRVTGCVPHPSYLPAKLLWMRRTAPDVFKSSVRWVSPGEYVHLKLLGRAVCSFSMASGTGLLDAENMRWHEPLLQICGISADQLSPLGDIADVESGLREEYKEKLPQLQEAVWLPAVGDGACSNIGCGCVAPDKVALMVGTSGAMRVAVPVPCETPQWGLWKYFVHSKLALVGGALSNGGNLVAWMRSVLRITSEDEEAVWRMPPDSHGLTFVPLLAGERSPGWAPRASGSILGLTVATTPREIFRAGLEAVAYRFALIHGMLRCHAASDHVVVATGKALLGSPAWMQIMADVLGRTVVESLEQEASSRGAALLALTVLGKLKGLEKASFAFGKVYEPRIDHHEVYMKALERQNRWYERTKQDWQA
ncbi:MAG: gluconokinase [Armatimonadota bacterium]